MHMPHIVAAATIWGWCLFFSAHSIVRLLFEPSVYSKKMVVTDSDNLTFPHLKLRVWITQVCTCTLRLTMITSNPKTCHKTSRPAFYKEMWFPYVNTTCIEQVLPNSRGQHYQTKPCITDSTIMASRESKKLHYSNSGRDCLLFEDKTILWIMIICPRCVMSQMVGHWPIISWLWPSKVNSSR